MQRTRTMELFRIFRRPEGGTIAAFAAPLQGPSGPSAAMASVPAPGPAAAPERLVPRGGRPPVPPLLTLYRPVRAEQLGASTRQALAKLFQKIPRPPRVLEALLRAGPDGEAASSEIMALLATQPRLAAAVLSRLGAVDAAGSGPFADVAAAIERVGAGPVVIVALGELLLQVFDSEEPERRALLQTTRQASVLACEITLRLARGVGFEMPFALAVQTALTFVGRLATITTMPGALLAKVPARGLLERSTAEQALLGLSSAEIGRWLMQQWELPTAVADEAAEVDAVLFAPCAAWEPHRASRLALCYLAARLGERLAYDPALQLESFGLLDDPDPEMYQLRGYLGHPLLAGVLAAIGRPELRAAVRRLRAAAG